MVLDIGIEVDIWGFSLEVGLECVWQAFITFIFCCFFSHILKYFLVTKYVSYQRAVAWDMLKVYTDFIEAKERRRYLLYNPWTFHKYFIAFIFSVILPMCPVAYY